MNNLIITKNDIENLLTFPENIMLKKLKITARNADKYKLFEEAVQKVDFEVDF
ncbi:MAG: hypothetical protein Ct9H90mP18_02490 [Gammaproteobacteria bacterium]|nr:MAG: hypothetical protein Ct9H90mP18_02490 [Gammaproteobacteria bacterium]